MIACRCFGALLKLKCSLVLLLPLLDDEFVAPLLTVVGTLDVPDSAFADIGLNALIAFCQFPKQLRGKGPSNLNLVTPLFLWKMHRRSI